MSGALTFENFDRLRRRRLYIRLSESEESIEEVVEGEAILSTEREENTDAIDAIIARSPVKTG